MSNKLPPWPPNLPTRPSGLRAVERQRADGSVTHDWYCRITKKRLPPPDDPGFFAALAAAREFNTTHKEGTVGAALEAWRRSPEFLGYAKNTKENRKRYTLPLERLGAMPLSKLNRGAIMGLRDGLAAGGTPAAANYFVASVGAFLGWCLDRGMVESNAATRIKPIKGGHLLAWTEPEARHAMATFSEAERRIIVLAYHTGQRRGDLIKLPWSAYDGARIRLVQEKTKAKLVIPVHPDLKRELDQWSAEKSGLLILANASGNAWRPQYASWCVQMEAARVGLRPGLNIHGLRKLAATRLAEAGCSAHEISAITGHKSLSMVSLYTASASQERLAEAALARLSQGVSQAVTDGRKVIKIKKKG
jgi:integrase